MSHITIRRSSALVSINKRSQTKNTRIIDALYNGGIEEHEDVADYYSPELTLKGVRVG